MNPKVFLAACSLLAIGSASASALAAIWSSPTTVNMVWQYNQGDAFIYLDGVSCDAPKPYATYFRLDSDAPNHDVVMRMLTAAHLAGSRVRFGYAHDSSGQYCDVTSVRLVK